MKGGHFFAVWKQSPVAEGIASAKARSVRFGRERKELREAGIPLEPA